MNSSSFALSPCSGIQSFTSSRSWPWYTCTSSRLTAVTSLPWLASTVTTICAGTVVVALGPPVCAGRAQSTSPTRARTNPDMNVSRFMYSSFDIVQVPLMFGLGHNFQIVGNREHAGYTLRCYLGERLIRCRVNVAFQGYVSVLDNDMNRGHRLFGITKQRTLPIDGAVFRSANAVICR